MGRIGRPIEQPGKVVANDAPREVGIDIRISLAPESGSNVLDVPAAWREFECALDCSFSHESVAPLLRRLKLGPRTLSPS